MNPFDYKAIIFDFDGTLVDSMKLWHKIDILFLGERGIECPSDLSYHIAGMSFPETAAYFKKRFKLKDDIDTIQRIWFDMSHTIYLTDIPFKAGALDFIHSLYHHGIRLAIASSNNRHTTSAYLEKHGVLDCFGSLCFTDEVGVGKPDPAVFLEAANQLNVAPDACLLFEDTLEGIQGGRTAGMDVVAVADHWQGERLASIKKLSDAYIEDYTVFVNQEGRA